MPYWEELKIITLYTIDCPKCLILEKKLKQKDIQYNAIKDKQAMIAKGITMCPMLDIGDGKLMNFPEAVKWVNEQ